MELRIIPHKSIGPLSFRQTPEEVQEALKGPYFALTGHMPELAEEKSAPQPVSVPPAAFSEPAQALMERYGLQVPSKPAGLPARRPMN